MATSGASFKSREDHRKQIELEEARKAGLAPAELDEDGKEINPHIPQYMSAAPWYLNSQRPSLKHQRNWKNDSYSKNWYERGSKVFQAEKFRKGACTNCGAMTHSAKLCLERPRKVGAKFTSQNIAADEKIEEFELDYDGKRDRWNGFEASTYSRVMDAYERRNEARKKFVKEEHLKKLEGGGGEKEGGEGEREGEEEEEEVDETRVDESKQMDFAKVEKRVRTTGGGSTGSVRNLRIREDTAKYLINLDVDSAYYDPKTRSMRADPNPDVNPNEKFYLGDNANRQNGQALEFRQLNIHALEAFEKKGLDVHVQASPSLAEMMSREFKSRKEKLKSTVKGDILDKYGSGKKGGEVGGEGENLLGEKGEDIPQEILFGQTEVQLEYDRTGRVVKGQDKLTVPSSRYEEDVFLNNHTTVYGSYWKDFQWGYACCHQTLRLSYCTGEKGREAEEEREGRMRENVERKGREREEEAREREAGDGAPPTSPSSSSKQEKPPLSSVLADSSQLWGEAASEEGTPLDPEKLKAAIAKQKKTRGKVEKDERKRKYNVTYEDEVTPEDMEAYRLSKIRHDDPMSHFVDEDE